MKFTIKLNGIKTATKIDGYWKNEDYIKLLELFDFDDAQSVPEPELFDMLSMAITDFEPPEAAAIVLTYKLGDLLNENQIQNISHEMLLDKISEEYSDIAFHYPLFNINQLLYTAYNGKFPKILASIIDIKLTFSETVEVNKEIALRTLSDLLAKNSLLLRLFNDQLDSEEELKVADSIIWELHSLGDHQYKLISSDYWFNNEDFDKDEYSGELDDDEIFHK